MILISVRSAILPFEGSGWSPYQTASDANHLTADPVLSRFEGVFYGCVLFICDFSSKC